MPSPTERAARPHPAAVRLRASLETLAGALAGVQLDALLASETDLADALSEIGRLTPDPSWDRGSTARELAAARATLTRCRRLGSTLGDVVKISLAAQGRGVGYGRQIDGRGPMHSLEVKV